MAVGTHTVTVNTWLSCSIVFEVSLQFNGSRFIFTIILQISHYSAASTLRARRRFRRSNLIRKRVGGALATFRRHMSQSRCKPPLKVSYKMPHTLLRRHDERFRENSSLSSSAAMHDAAIGARTPSPNASWLKDTHHNVSCRIAYCYRLFQPSP